MRPVYFVLFIACFFALGCTLLPAPKVKPIVPQGGVGGGPNVSVEVQQARERDLAALREVLIKRNSAAYKAFYIVTDPASGTSEFTIYSKPPGKERVDEKLKNRTSRMMLEDAGGAYRCDTGDFDSVCYRMPSGSALQSKPLVLKEEELVAKSPEAFTIMRAGAAPSSVGELAFTCFTAISIGTKAVVCYTQDGVPSYVKVEQAGVVREALMKSASIASDADFAPPAQVVQESGK